MFAFQDRHQNKDAYDLVYTLLNAPDGPRAAGEQARSSPVSDDDLVHEALTLLGARFADTDQDGPASYAQFVAAPDADHGAAQLRQQAVATVRAFLRGLAAD